MGPTSRVSSGMLCCLIAQAYGVTLEMRELYKRIIENCILHCGECCSTIWTVSQLSAGQCSSRYTTEIAVFLEEFREYVRSGVIISADWYDGRLIFSVAPHTCSCWKSYIFDVPLKLVTFTRICISYYIRYCPDTDASLLLWQLAGGSLAAAVLLFTVQWV